jgi:multidrug efflux pump subunit AcrA (membrane-fusion protein)
MKATVVVALSILAGCKGADATKTSTTAAMIVGPENIAIVKAQEIRSGPAISGNLTPEEQATVRAEIGGAVLQTLAEQGDRVNKGTVLARIDDSTCARPSCRRAPR